MSARCLCSGVVRLQVFTAVTTVHVPVVGDKALVGQRAVALPALEAVFVPLPFLIGHDLSSPKPGNGHAAGSAFLGNEGAVALGAVERVLVARELLPTQRLPARLADEALGVPGLLLVTHPSAGDGLLAVGAMLRELLLVARHTVDVVAARDEALRADLLQAAVAGETALMPVRAGVLKALSPWFDGPLAAMAGGCVGAWQTLGADDPLVLDAEGVVGQRAAAVIAAETCLMPVLALVVQLLGTAANRLLAIGAGVGDNFLVAAGAARAPVPLHEALSVQRLLTVLAAQLLAAGPLREPVVRLWRLLESHSLRPLSPCTLR